ncbi:MAG: M48 family metalloprotease [Oscillatoriales cyanobacterium SM2_2_1]|nr:M48 family metalloprotease [Oscillatoriales cyanobacterium SM2_2_1]
MAKLCFLAIAFTGLGIQLSDLAWEDWQSWLLVGGSVCLPLVGMFFGNHVLWGMFIGLGTSVRWISLGELGREHPRCLMTVEEICQRHRLPLPKLGVVKLKTPYFLAYGIRRVHFVMAAELLTALSDEELSLLLAQGLGQAHHGDLALVSFGSLIPTAAQMLQSRLGELPRALRQLSIAIPYVGTVFLVLALVLDLINWGMQRLADVSALPLQWVLRLRHYYADRFAAIATGNPQRLWRTLGKLAHLVVTHAPENTTAAGQAKKHLSAFTRLCVMDFNGAIALGSGFAYGANNEMLGTLLSWELFNPRANLLEVQSSHPLLGRRLHRLCQVPPTDEDLQHQVKTLQRQISPSRLSQGLVYEWLLTFGEPIWLGFALVLGFVAFTHSPLPFLGVPLFISAAAFSQLLQLARQFPRFGRLSTLPITRLLGDPYLSGTRGQPVQMEGILMQRGDRLFDYGSEFKLVDETGAVDLAFVHPLFATGKPFSRVLTLVEQHKSVMIQGWFYRTPIPMVRVAKLTAEGIKPLLYHHGSRRASIVALLTLLAIATFWWTFNSPTPSAPESAPPAEMEIQFEAPTAVPPQP